MKTEYINIALMPPDQPSKRELDREEFEQAAKQWVGANCTPEEIFSYMELSEWARREGFVLIDDNKDY